MNNEDNFWIGTHPIDCSWYWKVLHRLKGRMQDWYCDGKYCLTSNGNYSVSLGYSKLIGDAPKLEGAELIWTRIALSKHRFIMWLANQDKLLTKARMQSMGLHRDDTSCGFCDAAVESGNHFFSEYPWTRSVWEVVIQWLSIMLHQNGVQDLLIGIKQKHWNSCKKKIIVVVGGAVAYNTWITRN